MINFAKVFAAVIITKGEEVFMRKNGKPYLYLEGVEINSMSTDSPKAKILQRLHDIVEFQFSDERVRYIGITIHNTGEELCSVIHYWVDISYLSNSIDLFKKKFVSLKLDEIINNDDIQLLHTDRLAASRIKQLIKNGESSYGIETDR